MRIINESESCDEKEAKISFKQTVTGKKLFGCVSKEKRPTILKNITYYQGLHKRVQPFNRAISEKEIFDEYNNFGTKMGTSYIQYPDNNGDIRVGTGSGALLGGLDKELIFKQVDEETYEKVKKLKKKREEIEEIRSKHNFLFGDKNEEKMKKAREMEHELEREYSEITGWYL